MDEKKKTGLTGFSRLQCKQEQLIQNWFGLIFRAETCFNSFDRDVGAFSFVLSFSIVLSLYKRDTIRLVRRNRITSNKTIIYSKTRIHLHLNNTLLYYPIKPHPYQDILLLIKPSLKIGLGALQSICLHE